VRRSADKLPALPVAGRRNDGGSGLSRSRIV